MTCRPTPSRAHPPAGDDPAVRTDVAAPPPDAAASREYPARASLDFLRVELVHSTKPISTSKPARVHPWHEITYVCSGEYMVKTATLERTGHVGEVFFYPRGTPHRTGGFPQTHAELLCLNWQDPGLQPDALPLWRFDLGGRLRLLLDWMWELCPPANSGERPALSPSAHDLANSLLHAFLAEYASGSAAVRSGMVQRVHHYALHSFGSPIALRHLAQVAGMNKHAFVRKFRRTAGMTPMAYVRRMRVERAVHLLRTTRLPLKVVAAQVGAANEFLLSRWIRRETGRTAREHRMPPAL
jgi:AraC-like DNA-binding protein